MRATPLLVLAWVLVSLGVSFGLSACDDPRTPRVTAQAAPGAKVPAPDPDPAPAQDDDYTAPSFGFGYSLSSGKYGFGLQFAPGFNF